MSKEQDVATSTDNLFEDKRPVSPAPSNVSMKSEWSKDEPLNFKEGEPGSSEDKRPVSPAPSNVSMKSEWSRDEPLNFKEGEPGSSEDDKRPVSPAPSNVSMKSEWSKDEPFNFNEGEPGQPQRQVLTVPSSDQLKEEFDINNGLDETLKERLTNDLRKRICSQYEDELKKVKTETELYEIEADGKKKDEPQTYDDLFHNSQKKGLQTWLMNRVAETKEVRTVLMKGVAHIGKTVQTRRFMVDWAKGKSNKNIDLIVPLDFSELNSRRDEVQSMKELLCHSFHDGKHPRVCLYDECKIAFVLDGLEKCEILDFEKDKIVNDMEEQASMNVLLTSLIKGKLLPSALLLIISGPSGVDKIPRGYIDKVTECRDETLKERLTNDLRKRICSQYEAKLKEVKTETELYKIEADGKKKDEPQTYDDLFHNSQKKGVRTVLMKGVAHIGKTVQTRRFMVDWAKGESNKNIDLIVSFNFSELNSRRDKVQSMKELLCHSLHDGEHPRVCLYDECKIAFVLDGLEKCEILDFEKDEIVSDMEEQASMNVLLTSLIKGKLLPSALLLIISGPSGVDKIPRGYIDKVTECQDETLKERLTNDLRNKICSQYEDELKKVKTETELYEIEADGKKKDEPQTYDKLFQKSKEKEVRTVLMKGVAHIGKTVQTRRFMVDWAKGKSNKNIDLIVPLDFSELNSRRDKVQSMKELLCHSLHDGEHPRVCLYDECKIAFVLDGLEKCEILDFEKDEIVSDMEEQASMNVLLTSLIKGKLLPSALLLIISGPSGVDKIPRGYIDKVTECRDETLKERLTNDLRKRICSQYEAKLKEVKTETELYEIEADGKKKDEPQTYDDLFHNSQKKGLQTWLMNRVAETKEVRTVLMKGVAHIGKTVQTRRFMVDWAKGESNKNIDLIVPLDFSELNSRGNKVQSMKELLCHSLHDKHPRVCLYDECKIAFVLDGLEKCEILDFEKDEIVNDMEERASMNVLLTSLIKGNLLSSALLLITSGPSGVDKIPRKYIDKVTECRDETLKARPINDLRKRICSQYEDELKKVKTETELYEIEADGKKKDEPQTYDDLFQKSKEKEVRTVLMKGVAHIGKTVQTRRFMVDWAKGKSNKNIDLIVPLDFSKLNSRRDEVQSMKELLCHCLHDGKHPGVYPDDECKIAFVLDGLEKCEILDFGKDEIVSDMEERASINVLLTSLIKGNLLPSALLLIISGPSGVDKIPRKYIDKVTECRDETLKERLTNDLRKRICSQYEAKLKEVKTETELYEIEADGKKKDEPQTYDDLFHNSQKKGLQTWLMNRVAETKEVRTVLMKGVAHIGKTVQTRRFMVDWAKGKSNKNIDLIVPLDFSELNSRGNKVQSMKELLCHSLHDGKHPRVCLYDECKIAFVLDGLEKCEILDFEKDEIVSDMEEQASINVLLTSLIKGKLLPSALLLIISGPSGVDKIPRKYIDKVTECGDETLKERLTNDLRKRICSQYEDELKKVKTETELYEIEADGKKKDEPQTYDKLFHNSQKKGVRTVLMKGVAHIGKTVQTRRFMVDWAKGKSNKNIDLIVPLDFSKLNSRRDEVQSLKELLCHSLHDGKHPRVCLYDECKIAFVLDGLEKCEILDFEKDEIVNVMEERASINVLLTNLIKGNLLPSALLLITSGPSGVDKIPRGYIDKVTECRDETLKERLTNDLRKRICSQYEAKLKEVKTETELYKIEADGKKKDEPQTYDDLFHNSQKKGLQTWLTNRVAETKEVRTVLMKGVAHIGKTVQTRRFMVDWAKGKSNKNIDLIVPLDFSKLNSRRDKVQSLKELLCHSLHDGKHPRVCLYDECKIAFVLDGLEKCEILDFGKDEIVNDMEEQASMNVLLTSLIKGKLLPSALLLIISGPSGVDKIPCKYIDKVTECRDETLKERLTNDLRNKICSQYEAKLRNLKTETELYEIEADGKKKDEPQTYDELFHNSQKKGVRTVLMKGVAHIGKTVQTRRFMVDWAKGKSNKNIDLIVPLDFSELNSRRDKVQSMKELLCHSLHDKHPRVCLYDDCKIAFVLDGLEKCEILDFEKDEIVSDMEEQASMNVLLTNLIKGNLLPSALLLIISGPSGVDKIPRKYIDKVTECRETSTRRQQLISSLRNRFLRENTQAEDINHPHQKNTEHIMREERSSEVSDEEKNGRTVAQTVTQVNAVSDIFKDTKGQSIRTVLTIGEAGIGKSFHVKKFIKEWAKSDSRSIYIWFTEAVFRKTKNDEAVIFPLYFSKLNLKKDEKISLVGLLNHCFNETKEFVISNFEQFKVLFVLDGLDAYQTRLDFDNNTTLTDVREPATLDVLLTNLIRGTLFPSARIWITSRQKLPDTCVDRTTEIRCKPDIASQQRLKTQLKEQFTHVSEGIDREKTSALLNEIYTDLYIIEGERGEVNDQHETRQVQDAKFRPVTQETSIKYCDIFKPGSENKSIRTVLTLGVAGIGKSFATMKYMLDWAEGAANGDIFYMFPLSFRELNLRREKEHNLEELIHIFSPCMKTSEITDYDKYRILIVLDGFDEYRSDLVFNESNCTNVKATTSVNALLTNLIQGTLLPKAQIWITSRPAASNHIPAGKVDRVTEVRGFNDEQKEEYFRKRISDKDLAEKILSHVKKSRSLYIMCHIPVFCWITSKVLEDFMKRNEEGRMPKTLTDMYIYFLLLQCRQTNVKYGGDETGENSEADSCWNAQNKETVMSLGKLAFEGLEEGKSLFTEENLTECGVDITQTSVFSGLFTQIKREDFGLCEQKLFCFVHLSIQEFLAAFYVIHRFSDKGENLLTKPASTSADLPASDFYKTAVDKALESKNGDWDLFLRFLLGLSLETNKNLLRELLKKTENNEETNKKTTEYIKEKIREENSDVDRNCNLFHCLNELNDNSLVQEVKKYLHSETLTFETFSASQWSALTFVLLTSDEKLDVFDLKKYQKSENVLLGMLPVVKVSKTALLSWCELSEKSCSGLSSSVLSSSSATSNLTELDLSHNNLMDSGVQHLADGLKSLQCKLEILKLSGCQVTEKGCSYLATALEDNAASSLKQLDLSYNHPGVKGKKMLSDIAEDQNTSLKTLCFDHDGEHRLKPGLKKYGADLQLDENTASKRLVLSEGNRKVKTVQRVEEKVTRPEHSDRFKRTQVFCEKGQSGLCYWEVEWKGVVGIAVAYKKVGRRWDRTGGLGCNDMSWSLLCSKEGYTPMHDTKSTKKKRLKNDGCQKIAVFLDWEGGTLTYYSVTSGKLSHIHTFHAKFTEPLYPSFWLKNGSATLCEID